MIWILIAVPVMVCVLLFVDVLIGVAKVFDAKAGELRARETQILKHCGMLLDPDAEDAADDD